MIRREMVRIMVVAEMLFLGQSVCSMTTDFRHEYVQKFTDGEKPYKYFKSEEWIVEALFFDFNGDGIANEAILASPDQRYTDGNGWLPSRYVRNKGVEVGTNICEGTSIYCRNDRFYSLNMTQSLTFLVGRDVSIGYRGKGKEYYQRHGDAIIEIDDNLCFKVSELKHGLDAIVSHPRFKRLDSMAPEVYKGFDVKRQPPYYPFSHLVNISNKLTSVDMLIRPYPFDVFVNQYRQEVKMRLNVNRKVTVYAVFLDADNDGDIDAYVSSDVEKDGNGKYIWTLYLNGRNKFRKATATCWFNRNPTLNRIAFCVEAVDPVEVAGRNSFYRITRYLDGINHAVVILEPDGDRKLHSHAFLKFVPKEERNTLDFGTDDWLGRQEKRLGFVPPYDFRYAISRLEFLRLERLPCEEFPE